MVKANEYGDRIDRALIRQPLQYIRGKVREDYWQSLKNLIKEANVRTVERQDGDRVHIEEYVWPFPPIWIREVPVESDPDYPRRKRPYELVDGINRFYAAAALHLKTIPAIVRTYSPEVADSEAFLDQLTTNMAHGLRLDKDQRDEAIRYLVNQCGVGLDRLVKETGLSKSSISRIKDSKQRTGETGKRSKSQRGKKKKKVRDNDTSGHNEMRGADGFSPVNWWVTIRELFEDFNDSKRARQIIKHRDDHFGPISGLKLATNALNVFQAILDGASPEDAARVQDEKDGLGF